LVFTGTGEGEGRAEMSDRLVCFNARDCRVDHCGCAACKGAGHQQAIAPFDIGRNGQHRAGKNDPRKDRAIGWRKDDNRFKL